MGKQRSENDPFTVDYSGGTRRGGQNKRTEVGGAIPLRTKIPIERRGGRPSAVENMILNELIRNAAVLKGWLIVNNRVATGRAVNSIRIKITRKKLAGNLVSPDVSIGQINFASVAGLAGLAKNTMVGTVTGQILATPHLKFALQGRGAGTPPSTADILAWMRAKGVGLSDTRASLSQQAFWIARSIGEQGTQPPHFNESIRTQLTRVSAEKIVSSLASFMPKHVAKKYTSTLVRLGKLWDNIEVTSTSQSQLEFEEFI